RFRCASSSRARRSSRRPGRGRARALSRGRGPSRQRLPPEIVPGSGTPQGACRLACRRRAGVTRGSAAFGSRRAGSCAPTTEASLSSAQSILVLDDFTCHRDEGFIADLLKRTNTMVVLIPGGLTPLLQPLDRMLNKQMKRLLRGMYTAHTATAVADPKTGKLKPPGRGTVSTWCKQAWAAITPELVKTCF
ncbi:unnamed protein product, partial [Laminaria digitata]